MMNTLLLRGLAALVCLGLMAGAALAATCSADTVTSQPVGAGVYELAYSPSQHALYAAVSGGFSPQAPPSRIARLDPNTLRETDGFLLPYKAFGLTLDDVAGRLYIGHSISGRVTVLDTRTGSRVTEILLSPPRTDGARHQHDIRGLIIDPATRRLFVPGLSAGNSVLFVISLDTLTLESTLEGFGFYPTGLALDEAGSRLFVSGMDGDIRVVDTRRLVVTQHWSRTGIGQPINLAYDTGADRLYVVDQGMPSIREWQQQHKADLQPGHPGNRLVVLDGRTGMLLAQAPLEPHPLAIRLDPARHRVYVTERAAGTVAVLDSRSLHVLHRWSAGTLANSLAYDPQTSHLWVSVQQPPSVGAPPKDDVIARLCLPDTAN